jgi:hypothetical protein
MKPLRKSGWIRRIKRTLRTVRSEHLSEAHISVAEILPTRAAPSPTYGKLSRSFATPRQRRDEGEGPWHRGPRI